MNWFEEWFDENYLDLYANRNPQDAESQVDLIISALNKHTTSKTLLSGHWLDIGCGAGRYTTIFHNKGYTITGIDISLPLIEIGKRKHPTLDLRALQVDNLLQEEIRYDVLLSLFTSFGYYETDEENFDFLNSIGELGKPGAFLWLDFLNTEKILHDSLHDTISNNKNGKTYYQKRRIEYRPLPRVVKEINLYERNGKHHKTYRESVRLFKLKDFEKMLPKTGFVVKQLFGDYKGNSYTTSSPRLIICARKEKVKRK